MQRRVKWMVDRLSVPHIALRLRKEELCLAIGSLARLGAPYEESMLRQRLLQLLPSCTATELALVGGGSLSLQWCDGPMVDQLMSRAMVVGGGSAAPLTYETAGPLLLACAAIAWREPSMASERCGIFLAHDHVSSGRAISDGDSFAMALLGTTMLTLFDARGTSLSDEVYKSLFSLLTDDMLKMTDVGLACALAAGLILSVRSEGLNISEQLASLVRRAVVVSDENPMAIVPLVTALGLPQVGPSGEAAEAIIRCMSRVDDGAECWAKTDEMMSALLMQGVCLAAGRGKGKDILDRIRVAGGLTTATTPLSVGLLSLCYPGFADSQDDFVKTVIQGLPGEALERPMTCGEALQAAVSPLSAFQSRRAAVVLLGDGEREISVEELTAGLRAARSCCLRDPVVLVAVDRHISRACETYGAEDATRLLSAVGSDSASAAQLGVRDATYESLQKVSSGDVGGDVVAEVPLPLKFKALKLRGEPVSDSLLMSVLEGIEDWSAGDVAYFIGAAPDKCVEFDILLEKLSGNLEELSAEQLGFVVEAVGTCPPLAHALYDGVLSQAAEMVTFIGPEGAPLIAALISLFARSYSQESHVDVSSAAVVGQRAELRNMIEIGTGSILRNLGSANVTSTCGVMEAYSLCPSLGGMVAQVCCGHLAGFVAGGVTTIPSRCTFGDLVRMMNAMSSVDYVSSELIDAMVPALEKALQVGNVSGGDVSGFLRACIALDTPELDTLFQLTLGRCFDPAAGLRIETPDLVSVLAAALALRHREFALTALKSISLGMGNVKGSTQFLNSLSAVLGQPAACNTVQILSPRAEEGSELDILQYVARQLIESASLACEQGYGDEIAFAALLSSVSRLASAGGGGGAGVNMPASVMDSIVERIDSFSGADVAAMITALPLLQLGHTDPSLFLQCVITRLSQECHACTEDALSRAVFSLGELDGRIGSHISHHVAVDKISDHCVDTVHRWTSGQSICKMLYGFSRIACNKRSLFNVFGTQLGKRPLLSLLTREDVSFAMSAFGNAKYLDKELYDSLADHMLTISDELNAADLTLVLCGYSRLNLLNDGLYRGLGARVAAIAHEIPADASVRILCAYGHVGTQHEAMAEKLIPNIIDKVDQLDADQCVNSLYGIAQLSYDVDSDHLDALANQIVSQKDGMSSESIERVCEVMQELHWRNDGLLRAIADRSVSLSIAEGEGGEVAIKPSTARSVLDTLGLFMIHHAPARKALTDSARSVSRDPSVVAELVAASGNETSRIAE